MTKLATVSLLCVLGLSLVSGCGRTESNAEVNTEDYTGLKPFSPITKLENSAFYKKDGIFWKNVIGKYGEVGAKAYKGEFKDTSYGYLGHEIFLLPGQMLPEHNHFGNGSGKGFGPKMETWHIRHGSVEFFGEYKGTEGETPISEMPKNEQPWGYGEEWFKSKYVKKCVAGEIYSLNDPESYHFMRAGLNGAIVAEYATYHNDVKFSHPTMEFGNSEAARITKVKK